MNARNRTRLTLSAASALALSIGCGGSGEGATSSTGTVDAGGAMDASMDAAPDANVVDAPSTSCALADGGTGTLCGTSCFDLQNDPQHCGACTNAPCVVADVCVAALCQDVAGSLSGLRWELPCTTPSPTICPTVSKVVLTASLGGPSGSAFDVTLRFRGVVEARNYTGRVTDAGIAPEEGGTNASLFQVGGSSAGGGDANIYELDIDDPPQTFFLNSPPIDFGGVEAVDYTVTIPMMAAAHVRLTADPTDGYEYSNEGPDAGPVVPPGVPPAPMAFDGQFVQMDVVAVTPRGE
jgi:hypothetical protein